MESISNSSYKALREKFDLHLNKQGLKMTNQRRVLLDLVLKSKGHLSLNDISHIIGKKHPNIGPATVYRTLKLFKEAGIIAERHFTNGETQYEVKLDDEHHDHMICTDCGKIIEFFDPLLEKMQEDIAARYQFILTHHRMELYGKCSKCKN